MKKALVAFTLTAALVIPSASFASAESIVQPVTSSQSEVQITNLGQNANDAFFASQSSKEVIHRGGDNYVISPMSTDGERLYYSFSGLTNYVWTDSNLPIHRSGAISITLVQTSGNSDQLAGVEYQFATKDGTKKSSVIRVVGNITDTNTTINFSDVPAGTSKKPVYLLIKKVSPGKDSIRGNGTTS
ncbi:hypothetical protein ABIE27_005012 [Paenibacillus sp. 4624]|uniref:hypothetical protein n=1 Tax=Paenibacillus sp. 4624 TaxID=3156453 RepID=UPI003D21AAD0